MKLRKKNNISYILLLLALIVIMFAAVVVAQSLKEIGGDILGTSPTPTITSSPEDATPTIEDGTATPTETVNTPTPEVTPTPTPTPKGTNTPMPIIEKIDESKLIGLDDTLRTWSFEYPYLKAVDHGAVFKKNEDQKVIYLTIDEGYEMGYTSIMLDVLKEKNVKAIFFITGSYIRKNPDLVKRMVDEGHLVGNHTNTHPAMANKSVDDFIQELVIVEKEYEKLIGKGKRMYYYRPPAGAFSIRDINIANQMGYETVFWSFAYRDWEVDNQLGIDYAHDTVVAGLHDGMVLLLHAVSHDNAYALGRIIDTARELGYEFRRIDE